MLSQRSQRAKLLRRICRMQEWPALTDFLRALYTFAPSDDGLLGGCEEHRSERQEDLRCNAKKNADSLKWKLFFFTMVAASEPPPDD